MAEVPKICRNAFIKEGYMKKTTSNLVLLNGAFFTSLVIANIVASKIVSFGAFVVPAAIVAYPITFLMTDVIGQIWGKQEANKTVKMGFILQVMSLALIGLAILLPVAPFADNQMQFKQILGASFRVVAASMVAYLCSQSWDVWIFHLIKEKIQSKTGSALKGRWIWNNISTMTSQIIDTAIFITIAFYGIVPNIFIMILSQYVIKFIYAALDTPFFYLMTKGEDKK